MKLALLGDVGLFGRNSALSQDKMEKRFSVVEEILREYDVVIGNLETPLTSRHQPIGGKSAYLRSSTENIAILKYLHVTHVNLANNHMFDYGRSGFEDTLSALKQNSVGYFGVNGESTYIDSTGAKLALHGFCCYSTTPRGIMKHRGNIGIHPYVPSDMPCLMQMDYQQGYLSVLSVHAGLEHVHFPSLEHIRWARHFAQQIPYVYYGHHPHVLQGIEEYQESLIAYSLGNFCFDNVYTTKSDKPLVEQTEDNKKTIILSLEIDGNRIKKWRMIPVHDVNDQLIIDPSIIDDVAKCSDALSMDANSYQALRSGLIRERLQSRKSQRNFMWYYKRANFDTVRSLIHGNNCSLKYKRTICRTN